VLRKRRGRTLNKRIILKSYLARAADPSLPPGTPEVRQALGESCRTVLVSRAWTGVALHVGNGSCAGLESRQYSGQSLC
jgi:hypothetical protein